MNGMYKCNWCGTDLDVPLLSRDVIEIITEHEDGDVRVIVVAGEEHHRCRREALQPLRKKR